MNEQKSFHNQEATLYLVPTPIGNLEDMTYRAIEMLKKVDMIASEDTRNTQKLLNHFDITTPQVSLHEHNYKERVPQLVQMLKEGQSIAQVSDAGMPSISDPGHELVQACIEMHISVVALPGATAGVTALIASGLVAQPFLFYGFLPRKKKEAMAILSQRQYEEATMIFYESPYRVKQTLAWLEESFGPKRPACIARELTKIHEHYIRGTLQELLVYTEEHELKGEICLMVEGTTEKEATFDEDLSIEAHLEQLISEGMSSKEAIKAVAKARNMKKQEVYKIYHQLDD